MADHTTAIEIHVKCGEDFTAKIEWFTDEGEPIVLEEGLQSFAKMEVRDAHGDLIIAFDTTDYNPASLAMQGYIYVFTRGEIQLFIPWEATRDLPPGRYSFDLFADILVTDPNAFLPTEDGKQRRSIIGGAFVVHPNVTQIS